MHVVYGNRNVAGVLEAILNHLVCGIVENEAGLVFVNSIGQAIMFMHAKEN
jgi:hypothetical protein